MPTQPDEVARLRDELDHARTSLTEARDAQRALAAELGTLHALLRAGEASDSHHTHNELYTYRLAYHAHAAAGWHAAGIPVVKSLRHADGQECFGGGWFIVVAALPTGQVSNHYRLTHWDLFAVPEVHTPPPYDGHTPDVAADRLLAALAHPTTATAPTPDPDIPGLLELLAHDLDDMRSRGGHVGTTVVRRVQAITALTREHPPAAPPGATSRRT